MAKQTPIPQNPIGESFVWRDWFQRLSDRVFGTASTLDVPIEPEFGGTGLTTYNKGDIIYSNATDNLTRLAPPAATSLLQMTAVGVPSWTTAYSTTGTDTTYAFRSNNLSDLASVSTARTNLGVTATGSDTTYAYRANNLSDLASASTARINLGVTATGADTTYAYRANNLSDLASASSARTNLGLGTMAVANTSSYSTTGTDTTYAHRANNLSDLASASTARTNLGLGTMATENTGISTTVALAKLTVAGTNGSLTVANGVVTAYTAPT
jgi:hypothetical protein